MLDDVDVAARVRGAGGEQRAGVVRLLRADPRALAGCGSTRMPGAGGSTRRLNGTPSATPSDQSVSTLGLPSPASSWDSVDLAMPARRASSVRDRPARSRSRVSAPAIVAPSGVASVMFAPSDGSFVLTNDPSRSTIGNHDCRTIAPYCASVLAIASRVPRDRRLVRGDHRRRPACPAGWRSRCRCSCSPAARSSWRSASIAAGNPFAAVFAGLLLNARHVPFGLALGDTLGTRWRDKLVGSHIMTDESVAFALARPAGPARRRAYWATGGDPVRPVEHRGGARRAARRRGRRHRPRWASTPPSRPA